MKTTVNIFRTLLLAVLTLTFDSCSEDSLLSELGLDGQTTTRTDEVGEVWNGSIATAFAGGSGTAEDPYQIANGAQLARFAAIVNGTLDGTQQNTAACGKLTADIVLNDISNWENWESTAPANIWTPIGSNIHQFTGTLDGDGHSVSGIYINSEVNFQGLVGYLGSDGRIQNLGVEASYIMGGSSVGGLCGYNNNGSVSNSYNTGSVEGAGSVGGLCGQNSGTVTNCHNIGSVRSTGSSVGGVCGYNHKGSVSNCYNTGSVEGAGSVGGLCGYNYNGSVSNCYNTGSVEGNSSVGGLCGLNSGTVTNCYYLTGTANSGIGFGSGTSEKVEPKEADQFQSGAVVYLLQGKQAEQIWGQNISFAPKDSYPVLGGLKVVQNGDGSYANELNQNSDGFYLISTADELRLFASMVNGGQTSISAKLTADIVLNDIKDWESWETTAPTNSWTPIGSNIHQFTGTLDGDGHSISGIYINNSEEDRQGLVGYLGVGGTIQNLGVKASYIKGGNRVGGLCGQNSGTVTNCYNTGNLAGTRYVGGVCGENYSGTVTNCYNTGSVTGTENYVGGVCGQNDSGTVTNCYNTGSVTGTENYVGGVCGQNDSGTVTNCYNTGSVTGSNYIGGVCGQITGIMANCYNTGSVTGSNHIGGVCGLNRGTVTNCYYLTGKANSGIGSDSGTSEKVEPKEADQFQSGAVAYLLQGKQAEQVWGQLIGTDLYPVLGEPKVYNNNGTYSNMVMEGDYYLISTADELRLFASMVNGGQTSISAKLTADIVLNDIKDWESWETTAPTNSWTPIGSNIHQFTGTLDGDGHSISGIYINNSEEDRQGLVGYLGVGGTIQNLGVKASYIKGGNRVGGLCGQNSGTVTNCYNTGNLAGTRYVGGVCGENYSGTVTNCYNTGSVTGTENYVGGVCGQNDSGTVTNCYNTGSVTGSNYIGGVCGQITGIMANCYNTGSVTGSNYIGGVCGLNRGTVTNCHNIGSVTGTDNVGGVCGYNFVTVTNCYYLTGKANSGIGGGSGDAIKKTEAQFKSGEVASLLGEGWGQTIGPDDYPVPTSDASKKVYAYTMYQGQSTETGYANNNGNVDLDLTSHPNTIAVFEASGTFAGKNIVVKDGDNSYTCAELVLTDDADFYTPVAFTATNATYTRTPSVWATNDGSGWETICLPFSGTLYANGDAKQPVLTDLAGDYWLRSLTDFKTPNTLIFASGSTATAADHQIKAGVPYIIALPGTSFGSESLQGQTISVRGTNVTVTNEAQSVAAGSMFAFTGTFATKACDAASYRLNSENGSNGAGNLFVLDTNKLAPFRCRIDVIGLNIGGTSRSASGLPRELRIGQ